MLFTSNVLYLNVLQKVKINNHFTKKKIKKVPNKKAVYPTDPTI